MKRSFDANRMARPSCAGFEPYVAGRPIEAIKRELGLTEVIKLASNENPLGPSPKAVAAVKAAAGRAHLYPDSGSYDLRAALAKRSGLPAAQVTLGAGSDEIIETIAKAFFDPKDDIVVSAHAFIRYRMAGQLMNARVITVPMRGYTHDLAAMARAVTPRTKAVFVANPNNPTGTYNTAREVSAFLAAVGRRPRAPIVVMDEAYYEYARRLPDYPEMVPLIERYPNLIVLRTFSKIYGLAGLRVGYGFSSAGVIGMLERVRPPFNVNAPAQAAAIASLADARQVSRSVRLVESGLVAMRDQLFRRGISCVPSAGNFLLMDCAPRRGADVFKRLLARGIIVRAMDEYDYPTHIRVTVGLPAQNRRFLSALDAVLRGEK